MRHCLSLYVPIIYIIINNMFEKKDIVITPIVGSFKLSFDVFKIKFGKKF